MPDNASTELALVSLLRETLDDVRALAVRVGQLEHNTQHRHTELMTALETLTGSVTAQTTEMTNLTAAVNEAIVELGADTPTDAQLLTLATAIDANTAQQATLATTLRAAITPPVVPVP